MYIAGFFSKLNFLTFFKRCVWNNLYLLSIFWFVYYLFHSFKSIIEFRVIYNAIKLSIRNCVLAFNKFIQQYFYFKNIVELHLLPWVQLSPWNPGWQPLKQRPSMWWHCSLFKQWPHNRAQSWPYRPPAHSVGAQNVNVVIVLK